MCVIIELLPNKKIGRLQLFNAAANNWHSWGIVIKDPEKKTLEVIKRVPKGAELPDTDANAGGTWKDLEEIEEILYRPENIGKERFVHFRHATKGHVNLDNCHPFEMTNKKNRRVVFMHNGNFHGSLGVSVYNNNNPTVNGQVITNAPSDTKEFVEKYIKAPLTEFVNGDYTNKTFQDYIWGPAYKDKGLSSRCIFISNDLPTLRIGEWATHLDADQNVEYYSSNDTYFDKVDRGPLNQIKLAEERRLKEEERAKEKAANNNGNEVVITPYEHGMFQPDPKVLNGLKVIFRNFGAGLHPGEIADLIECGIPEFEAIIKTLFTEGEELYVACFLNYIIASYAELNDDLKKSREKHDEATKKIATLKAQINAAESARAA